MELFDILAPSGREQKMSEYITKYAESYGYNCRNDVFGNLICEKGHNIKTAVECGMDNVSIMKTASGDKGEIRVAVPNSAEVKNLVGKKIRFLNGVTAIIRCDKNEEITDFDLVADIGADSKDEAESIVPTGEFATVVCDEYETDKYLFGNDLASYIPVKILLETMKTAENTAFLFTAQKKFAGRGLNALFEGYDIETVVSVNTLAEKSGISCGKGAVVVVKEKNSVPSVSLRQKLISFADDDVQLGATEETLFLDMPMISGKGALCGGVCVAVRGKGKPFESVAKSDIDSAVNVISNYLKRGM